jgi:hypothetical protein
VGSVSDPGNISVRPDQEGGWSGDRAEYRKLPHAGILSVDQLDPVGPWGDVKDVTSCGFAPQLAFFDDSLD